MEPKVYLSHGLGVNSWALYLYLIGQGEIPGETFEAVAVDHGTDWPETYEYLEMMLIKGYPVTVLIPEREGCTTIHDYCAKWRKIPGRMPGHRWCTQHFKVEVVEKYYQKPAIELIGFDAGESNRRHSLAGKTGIEQDFPLMSAGIDRKGCEDLIKRHGLPVPTKSGCFICPFQSRKQWVELRDKHPELFCKAQKLEKDCNDRRKGKKQIYFSDRPLEYIVMAKNSRGQLAKEGAQELFQDYDRPPCRCAL